MTRLYLASPLRYSRFKSKLQPIFTQTKILILFSGMMIIPVCFFWPRSLKRQRNHWTKFLPKLNRGVKFNSIFGSRAMLPNLFLLPVLCSNAFFPTRRRTKNYDDDDDDDDDDGQAKKQITLEKPSSQEVGLCGGWSSGWASNDGSEGHEF